MINVAMVQAMVGQKLVKHNILLVFCCPKTETLKQLFTKTMLNRNQLGKRYPAILTPPNKVLHRVTQIFSIRSICHTPIVIRGHPFALWPFSMF